ncbi:hypothetical protein HY643_05005 [Candidatus Woesearchaeota archaeon]|nr:hypothetical protein [Candidatus Woesearchaeota archaeon]
MGQEALKKLFEKYAKKSVNQSDLGIEEPKTLTQELLMHPELEKNDFGFLKGKEISCELLVQGIYDRQFNRREQKAVEELLWRHSFEKKADGAYYKDGKFVGYLLDFC